jgi:hypothetical chaperone protein
VKPLTRAHTPDTIGIDFGTTNSAVARTTTSGLTEVAWFPTLSGATDVYRSILYFEQLKTARATTLQAWTGPAAIDHYLAAETRGRLIQSLKSFLSSRTLQSTEVFGRRYTVEALIARILRDLRERAEAHFASDLRSAVVGRPVRFVGAENEADNAFAEARLGEALRQAGFERVRFELEPIAAARFYEASLDHDELILIGDFGGGTSDFSLMRVGPVLRERDDTGAQLLGNAGLGLAGDAFDAAIVRHLVSPALGAGGQMQSMGKRLPVPLAVYSKLERWHYLSLLRTRQVLTQLEHVRHQADEPERIAALIHLITQDLGYQLHRSVQALKIRLSTDDVGAFHFADGALDIAASVTRAEFESWIEAELQQIETCVDGLLQSVSVDPGDVDAVFLTGGTSLVPAVRRLFESRFGAARIRSGKEFTSVVRGLSLSSG